MNVCKNCENFTERRPLYNFTTAEVLCERCFKKCLTTAKNISLKAAEIKRISGVSYRTFLEFAQEERPDV